MSFLKSEKSVGNQQPRCRLNEYNWLLRHFNQPTANNH